MQTNRICFINQKGGCGKSSSCFHLAGYFAKFGLRVLAIDADPQGSLSQGFFGSEAIENLSARETLAAVFADDDVACANVLVTSTRFERISVIRANAYLAQHNTPQKDGYMFALSIAPMNMTEAASKGEILVPWSSGNDPWPTPR
jgi:chromosome partitioning protein